jgi:hypothetical protein
MSYEDEPMDPESDGGIDPAQARAADRVKLPAIFLIVVGVLNVLGALYFVGDGARTVLLKDQMTKEIQKGFEEQRLKSTQGTKQQQQQQEEILNKIQGWFGGDSIVGLGITYIVVGLLALLAAALTIFGAVRMLSLRSRGLAICGALVACIPCLSVTGCCGLGEGIGIWALIVLMAPDVKAAFR